MFSVIHTFNTRWHQKHWNRTGHLLCSYVQTQQYTEYVLTVWFSHVGLKESAVMPHADSVLLAEVEDEIRRQMGVVYSQDCQ